MIHLLLSILISVLSWAQTPPSSTTPPAAGAPANAAAVTAAAPDIDLENEYEIIKKNLEPFIYNSFDLRDPFKRHQSNAPLVPGGLYGPFLPLQYFQLTELKLKGILWKVKEPKILIEDPKGVLHRLGVRDYLGENFGYIAVIREKEVVIVQTIFKEKSMITETKLLTLN